MDNSQPMISVIIPVFNGERYIREALNSVLAQAYDPLEVIVVDDGSTDGVAAVLADEYPGVRYHYQEHAGLPTARNTGIALADGDCIGFLDSDDVWMEGKLAAETAFLRDHPEMEAVFGHIRQFFSPDADDKVRKANRIAADVLPGIHPDTMLIRAVSIRRVGRFNPAVEMGEFLDWFARAQEAGLAHGILPDVLAMRRIHAGNMSIRRRVEAAPAYAHLLKAALERRRKAGPSE
jgi:glycosyltransferase involved in cell wall biosynthesis